MTGLRWKLEEILPPRRILDRPIDRAAYASDASFYRLEPLVVVRPESIEEVRGLFTLARAERLPLTFRAAGTSLSGQAITDGILVDLGHGWRRIEPLESGRRVRVQPGAIGGHVNRALAKFNARIGPDPASIDACMMGGILSNNSSGMCCGVAQNSYHTLDSLVFVLPSGTVIDTARNDANAIFEAAEPSLAAGIVALRDRVRTSRRLTDRIRHKYKTKNTTGYALNAFLDFERPVDIFRHLLIGAEGTLAFIAEAVLRTVPDLPVKYTGLLLFADISAACEAIGPLSAAGAAALELMDRAALRSVEHLAGVPSSLAALDPEAAGLLAEFQCPDESATESLATRVSTATAGLTLVEPARFTFDPVERTQLWRVRKGMFPSVGAVRARGTTVIIEDVAFPVHRLAAAVGDLQSLFRRHGYVDAIIFGHAKDGNLHFVLSQSFNDDRAIRQYELFIADVVRLVVEGYDGALKAEHGTGRNMAPFVETEWGPEAYELMWRLKALIDPDGLLNPGVIVNGNPRAHLESLKSLPEVEEEVDRCIECGYCESRCPSRDLTLSPRQRIAVRRAMERQGANAAALRSAFTYDALDTCATDGLCALACPVAIDTGKLTKRLRATMHSRTASRLAVWSATHFGLTERLARAGLRLRRLARPLLGVDTMPAPARRVETAPAGEPDAILFPSCVTRVLGPLRTAEDGAPVSSTSIEVARRAGVVLHVPDAVYGRCCGMPYSSKGFDEAQRIAANATIADLWTWSREGTLPVVVDTSPCALALRGGEGLTPENAERLRRLRIVDAIDFFASNVLPRLTITRRARTVVVHPVCSLVRMSLTSQLSAVASACSDAVVIPSSTGCCGFAGDRGWLVPELTASATRAMAEEIRAIEADGHYSSSRTCELGMSRATGFEYRSWVYLVEWATRDEARSENPEARAIAI
jgi:D-lactate dehydrogenase